VRIALVTGLGLFASKVRADDWPQWLGPQRDSIWRETGLVEKFPEGGPPMKWRAEIAGGYAGPAVADGRVFVMDYVTTGNQKPNPTSRSKLDGTERVLCFDATDGKQLWKHEYDCHYEISYPAGPRATPAISDDKVYTLGAEGNLFCLNVATGKEIWSHDLKKEYKTKTPMWGFCSHPLIESNKLFCIVGGEGSVAVAFDKDTGKEIWRALSAKEQGYSAPMLMEAGGKKQLVIWHAESINGLDPETGKVYWTVPIDPNYAMSIMTPRKEGDFLFAGAIEMKAVMLKLSTDKPGAEVAWRGKKDTGLYPVNATPFLTDGLIYGIGHEGELRAVKVETGERLWESLAAATNGKKARTATAFLVKNGDRYVLMNDAGDLILAKITPKGYEEISRANILKPTGEAFGRSVVWSHPAFANRCVFARNDKEIVCVSLAAK
jgi:outer membrane protein assembly factor BamB